MKILILLTFVISCSHIKPNPEEKLVSLDTALMQAQASYLKGCVDGLKDIKIPVAFPGCRDKSIIHRQELESIMEGPDEDI
jgi:hypothetical protein